MGNFSGGGDSFGVGREKFEEEVDSGLGTSAEIHGVEASSKVLHTLGVGCTGENSGCCCPVTVTLFVFGRHRKHGFKQCEKDTRPQKDDNTYRAPRFSNLFFSVMDGVAALKTQETL